MMNNGKGKKNGRLICDNGCVGGNGTTWIRTRSKSITTISKRSLCGIRSSHSICLNKVTKNKRVNILTQPIHIFHQDCDTIDDTKLVSKELLGPMSKLVNTFEILKYFLNYDTIVDSVKNIPHKYLRQQKITHLPHTTSPTK